MTEPRNRVRRERSVTESLLSIVLVLEALLVFFAMLVAFGLHTVEPGVAFGGGGALIVLLVLAGGMLRTRWGMAVGWVLQAMLLAIGLILPLMYAIGAAFLALWIFCFVRGRQIDTQKAAFLAAQNKENNA
ncbi:MAG: DUF4233 domain-containing protein [Microbacteriaceae bacterium]